MNQRQLDPNIKMDSQTALDAFNALGKQKISDFETVGELATAMKPYLYLTTPLRSREMELEGQLEVKDKELEKLKKEIEKLGTKPDKPK